MFYAKKLRNATHVYVHSENQTNVEYKSVSRLVILGACVNLASFPVQVAKLAYAVYFELVLLKSASLYAMNTNDIFYAYKNEKVWKKPPIYHDFSRYRLPYVE